MAKTYYDNSDEGQRFQPGTTAEGEAVDQKFDEIAAGFQEAERDTRRALKFPYEPGMDSQEFQASAFQRRNRVLGFDTNGDLALVSGFFNRGDWQPNTVYFLNDVVRDPATTNLYVLIVSRHESGDEPAFDDPDIWYMAIDADTVRTNRIAAEEARNLAELWAISLDAVANDLRGARYYALSARGDEQASRGYRDEALAARDQVVMLEQSASDAKITAVQAAGEASGSAQSATDSKDVILAAEQNVIDTAQQVAANAQDARDSADEAESVSERISGTTTMDFLNFELVGPDLIAHFAGYSDTSKFSINAAGELEVTL